MPLPICHLYYADLISSSYYHNKDFFWGNLVPDSHYFKNGFDSGMHYKILECQNMISMISSLKNDSLPKYFYKVGIITHSYIDNYWRNGVFVESESPFIKIVVQLVDEKIVFDMVDKFFFLKILSETDYDCRSKQEKLYVDFISGYLGQDKWDINIILDIYLRKKKIDEKYRSEIICLFEQYVIDGDLLSQLKELKTINKLII